MSVGVSSRKVHAPRGTWENAVPKGTHEPTRARKKAEARQQEGHLGGHGGSTADEGQAAVVRKGERPQVVGAGAACPTTQNPGQVSRAEADVVRVHPAVGQWQ